MPAPPVALLPEDAMPFLADAVVAGGGTLVAAADAEVLVWADPRQVEVLRSTLAAAPAITWVQLPWAGVEPFAAAGVFGDGRTWTCAKGVYGEQVAEHALALGLAGLRRIEEFARARSWSVPRGRSLYDGKVTVVGGGGIAECLVTLLAPFRVEITVVRQSGAPFPGARRTLGPHRLREAVAGADLVVLAVPLTPETTGMVDAGILAAMEPHAWLVNVGRGAQVVTADLVGALEQGRIGGAALDVTDPEPLPDGHPLWDLPNCVISPHTANTPAMSQVPLARRITENLRRYAAGEALLGLVDAALGY